MNEYGVNTDILHNKKGQQTAVIRRNYGFFDHAFFQASSVLGTRYTIVVSHTLLREKVHMNES